MFSSSPLSQFYCKLFAKMGDDRPFVCNAPGCGQVRLFFFPTSFLICVSLPVSALPYLIVTVGLKMLYLFYNLKLEQIDAWEETLPLIGVWRLSWSANISKLSVIYVTRLMSNMLVTFYLARSGGTALSPSPVTHSKLQWAIRAQLLFQPVTAERLQTQFWAEAVTQLTASSTLTCSLHSVRLRLWLNIEEGIRSDTNFVIELVII